MKTNLPAGANPLPTLDQFSVKGFNFNTILDFGRYIIRLDPQQGRGYFHSEIRTGAFEGVLVFISRRLAASSVPEIPPQVRIAFERAGYVL